METFIALIAFISFIVFIILTIRNAIKYCKSHDASDNRHKKHNLRNLRHNAIYMVICFVIFIVGAIGSGNKQIKQQDAPKIAKQNSEKQAAQSSKKADDAQINKNQQRNIKQLKADLGKVPSNTKNTITKASYDDDSGSMGTVTLTLSNELLQQDDSSLNNVARGAWNGAMHIINRDGSYPKDNQPTYVTVQDSNGNTIAETSAFGSYKFKD